MKELVLFFVNKFVALISKRHSKKEYRDKNLKRIKYALEKFYRYEKDINRNSNQYKFKKEIKEYLNISEKIIQQLNEALLDCPGNISPKVEELKTKIVAKLEKIKSEISGFRMIKLPRISLEDDVNNLIKAIDKALGK